MRSETAKAKVTVSVARSLVSAVDDAVRHREANSRSAVVEDALRLWRLEHKRAHLEQEVERYYRSLSAKERQEDQQWARFASRQAKRLWED
jgi:metal-responsive CopG/Arc/MetJ family transcriptional regulator